VLDARKAPEVAVGRVDGCPLFDREGREVRVRREVSRDARRPEEVPQDEPVAWPRSDCGDEGLGEPGVDVRDRMVRAKGPREDARPSRDPEEGEEDRRTVSRSSSVPTSWSALSRSIPGSGPPRDAGFRW
jgi:hypothetical protein